MRHREHRDCKLHFTLARLQARHALARVRGRFWVRRQYSTCRLYDVSGKESTMGNCDSTGEKPFRNGLRQKPHNRMDPGDEDGEGKFSPESIQDIDADVRSGKRFKVGLGTVLP